MVKKLKIAFNARTLATDHLRGWSRYTSALIKHLSQLPNIELYLLTNLSLNPKWVPSTAIVVKEDAVNYIFWEQITLPRMCHQLNVDLLHCPINYGLPYFGNIKKILTLHDAIETTFYGPRTHWRSKITLSYLKNRILHRLAQKAANHIITVSHHAKGDIVKNYHLPPDSISVIYEAAADIFDCSPILDIHQLQNFYPQLQPNYYFYVGGFEERKNIPLLFNALKKRNKKEDQLILAGKENSWSNEHKKLIRNLGLQNKVFFIGPVEDSVLPSLYANAKCFLYPSFYEGFGLQIVEALQVGTPVLCSNSSCLIEVLGDEECGFEPHSPDQLITLLDKMDKENFYNNKKIFAQKRRHDFSWEQAAQQTLQLYKKVLSS